MFSGGGSKLVNNQEMLNNVLLMSFFNISSEFLNHIFDDFFPHFKFSSTKIYYFVSLATVIVIGIDYIQLCKK